MQKTTKPKRTPKSQPSRREFLAMAPPTPVDSPIHCAFPTNRTIEGFLKYRECSEKKWRNYYFVLSNNFLLAAPEPTAQKLSRVIPVEGKSTHMHNALSFTIAGRRNAWQFEAEHEDETKRWVNAIEQACRLKVTDVYRFRREIGSGSNEGTIVVEAEHRSTCRKVAIKVISKRKIKNKQRLSQEINIMKQLRHHSCIVELYDIYESKKNLYLVMELCKGGELLDALAGQKQGYYGEDITCHVVHQIARALDYMHMKGIVHRDLKPENILCVKKGSPELVKVADFGISKHMEDINHTMNTPVGTLTYMSPELLRGEPYGKEVDYWAVGVIMHLMLCGYSPWEDCSSELEIQNAITSRDIELVEADWLHVSQVVKDLILRLLDRQPMKRATIDEILQLTWKDNTAHASYGLARRRLKKTMIGDRVRHVSTGGVEANIHLMKRVFQEECNRKQADTQVDETKTAEAEAEHRLMVTLNERSKSGGHRSPRTKSKVMKRLNAQHRTSMDDDSVPNCNCVNNGAATTTAASLEHHDPDKLLELAAASPAVDRPNTNRDTQPMSSDGALALVQKYGNKSRNEVSMSELSKNTNNCTHCNGTTALSAAPNDCNGRRASADADSSNSNFVKAPKNRRKPMRRLSRDDSDLAAERIRVAKRSIEKYISQKKRKEQEEKEDNDDDVQVFQKGYSLFDV